MDKWSVDFNHCEVVNRNHPRPHRFLSNSHFVIHCLLPSYYLCSFHTFLNKQLIDWPKSWHFNPSGESNVLNSSLLYYANFSPSVAIQIPRINRWCIYLLVTMLWLFFMIPINQLGLLSRTTVTCCTFNQTHQSNKGNRCLNQPRVNATINVTLLLH